MKETFGQKTRRSHKRNQRVVMFWCAFVFAFVIAGVWLFRGTLFQNDSGASSSGTNQSRHLKYRKQRICIKREVLYIFLLLL